MNQLNRFEEKDIEYEHPLIPADPSSNQDGSVIGVPEVTNTSSTTEEEQREDGSVNEVPELTNASNTTGEEQIETDYVTLTTESATPNITGEEANENDSMILPAELVPSSTTEMEPGESVEVFKDTGVIHDTDIHSDGRHTAHNSQEDNRTEMSDNRVTEDKYKDQEMGFIQQATSETQAHKEEFLSGQKPATYKVYSNLVRNEKNRMMTSIDRIVVEATHLFGPEKTQIFFDLLAENMPNFEPAGASSEFEPNMADLVTRQHVIFFFEHANYVMTQIMTSLSSVPDSERLQQMPEPDFRALIERVIESSLESKSNIANGLCLEGNRLIVDDWQQFIETLGEKIPEKILNRLNPGHEVVVYRFVNKNEERSQPTEKTENRQIHSIYFPSDCRLFI